MLIEIGGASLHFNRCSNSSRYFNVCFRLFNVGWNVDGRTHLVLVKHWHLLFRLVKILIKARWFVHVIIFRIQVVYFWKLVLQFFRWRRYIADCSKISLWVSLRNCLMLRLHHKLWKRRIIFIFHWELTRLIDIFDVISLPFFISWVDLTDITFFETGSVVIKATLIKAAM